MKEINIVSTQRLKQYLHDNLQYKTEVDNRQNYQQVLDELVIFANQLTWNEQQSY
ncbi:MAG: hypothetical protein ABF630_02290 [Liquorilactobacillus sp.]|uniref:hypothetical protein n=1 Tax=Liquorilactobacillus sp. TaxID=2767923 RepID=UPI0039E7B10A